MFSDKTLKSIKDLSTILGLIFWPWFTGNMFLGIVSDVPLNVVKMILSLASAITLLFLEVRSLKAEVEKVNKSEREIDIMANKKGAISFSDPVVWGILIGMIILVLLYFGVLDFLFK